MLFSTVSEHPLDTSLTVNHANSDLALSTGTLTDPSSVGNTLVGSSLVSPLGVSTGVRVTTTDFIGDTLTTAYNIGDINDFRFSYADRVNSSDVNDFYRFRLDNSATISLGLTGLLADADLYLLDSAGNTVNYSIRSGSNDELIYDFLNAGVYYAQVRSFFGANTAYSLSINGGGNARDPGADLSSARDLGNLSRRSFTTNNFVGTTDPTDYYRFDLSENGNFHLSLGSLSSDIDVALYDRLGNFITASFNGGSGSETIDRSLAAGSYYIRVFPYSGSSAYTLSASTNPLSSISDTFGVSTGTRTLAGTLGADIFNVTGNYTRTVVSGNGNVDFNSGLHDVLDLSGLLSTSITINYANNPNGGVFYDPGNGTRVFDSILLNDGRQILFEGIDEIRFSDRTINLAVTPNDPRFGQQWNLGMMNVQNAWRFTTGSNQVMVGISDTGVAVNGLGDDLHGFSYSSANGYTDDFSRPFSHGTAVQSIIGATSNNGLGMTGINWNSDFFVTDVLGGNTGDFTLAQATNVMATAAASQGQRLVINLSLGVPSFNLTGFDPAFEAAVAANPNVLFVIAAGNDGDLGITGLSYPATLARTYSNVMAVGAVWGQTDYFGGPETPGTRINYPNWWGSQFGDGLTLMGPSEVLAQSTTGSPFGQTSFDYTIGFNGTSAATPNVTGVASLVWSANANLTATQVRQILAQTATDLGSPGYDQHTGNGFVNADAAVRRAIAIGAGYA